jgi:hypothetical protein
MGVGASRPLVDHALTLGDLLLGGYRMASLSAQEVSDQMHALTNKLRSGDRVAQAVWVLLFGDDRRWAPDSDVEVA